MCCCAWEKHVIKRVRGVILLVQRACYSCGECLEGEEYLEGGGMAGN